jgi:ABC-2 type transport system ATP-binding protein
MLQKVQVLAAIIHQPDLLILDEPFSGLDPVSTRQLRDVILEEHDRGATVLFSTHVMAQAEELCEHVVMIHRGRKVLDEQITNIRRRYDPRTIRFEPLDTAADISTLRALAEVERIDPVAAGYDVLLIEGADPGAAIRHITMAITPARIELARPRLEDVFVRIVTESSRADAERAVRTEVPGFGSGGTV